MNIKKLLGLQSQEEKIRDYRALYKALNEIKAQTETLAEDYSLQKSQVDSLDNETDLEIRKSVMKRFEAFLSQQKKEVITLCNKKVRIEKSMKTLENDAEVANLLKECKMIWDFERQSEKGVISKSVLFNIFKAKEGVIRFSDVLVSREVDGKLLILQRAFGDGPAVQEWCIPGGHVDPGETFVEAAARELFEESGIKKEVGELQEVAIFKNDDVEIHYFMTILPSDKSDMVLLDSEEEIGSMWIDPRKEIDDYNFIFDMKDNIKRILGIDIPDACARILKAFCDGEISEKVFKAYAENHKEDIRKANNKTYFSHKERKDLAKKGEAMPNGKFPIRNSQDLKDAIRLAGSSDMPESEVKAWIRKRAKALGLESELPESWEDVEKTMTAESTAELRKEDLDKKVKNITKPEDPSKDKEESIEKATLPEGFGVYVNFNDMDEASLFKSLVEELKANGRLSHIEDIIEKGFEEEESEDENENDEPSKNEETEKSELKEKKDKGSDEIEKAKSERVVFNKYLNFIEGAKTRLKNIHWGETDNSKHLYLDDLSDAVSDFEDKIAEAGQASFGRFKDGEIEADEITEDDPVKICQKIFKETVAFRKELEGKDDYNGEISWIDDFLATLKQTKYRLQMN